MLRAYIDDCGSAQKPVSVLAGLSASPAKWGAFSDAWRDAMNHGRSIRIFKEKHALGSRPSGQFNGWSERERDEKVLLLADVITKHADIRVYSWLFYDECNDYFSDKKGREFSGPLMINFYSLIRAIAHEATPGSPNFRGHGQKTQIVFDKSIIKGMALRVMDEFWRIHGPKLEKYIEWPPKEEDDEHALPLQAADLVAGIKRRAILHDMEHIPYPEILRRTIEKLDGIPWIQHVWTRKLLKDHSEMVQKAAATAFPFNARITNNLLNGK